MQGEERGSFFPCYLKSLLCFVLPSSSFFYFTLPTSSSFLPINPPINLSPLFYLPTSPFTSPPSSLVHSPSVTLTSTAGDTPAVFGPPASRLLLYYSVYSTQSACACDSALWTVYEYTSTGTCTLFCPCEPAHVHSCVCFFSARPPSWRQLIYNLTRQRKFVMVTLTQNRTLHPAG